MSFSRSGQFAEKRNDKRWNHSSDDRDTCEPLSFEKTTSCGFQTSDEQSGEAFECADDHDVKKRSDVSWLSRDVRVNIDELLWESMPSIFDVMILHSSKTDWDDLREKNDSTPLNWACCSVFRVHPAFSSTTPRCSQCSKTSELHKCDDHFICETVAYHSNNTSDVVDAEESPDAETNIELGHKHHHCSWNRIRRSDQSPSIGINILRVSSVVHAESKLREWWTESKNEEIKE